MRFGAELSGAGRETSKPRGSRCGTGLGGRWAGRRGTNQSLLHGYAALPVSRQWPLAVLPSPGQTGDIVLEPKDRGSTLEQMPADSWTDAVGVHGD